MAFIVHMCIILPAVKLLHCCVVTLKYDGSESTRGTLIILKYQLLCKGPKSVKKGDDTIRAAGCDTACLAGLCLLEFHNPTSVTLTALPYFKKRVQSMRIPSVPPNSIIYKCKESQRELCGLKKRNVFVCQAAFMYLLAKGCRGGKKHPKKQINA